MRVAWGLAGVELSYRLFDRPRSRASDAFVCFCWFLLHRQDLRVQARTACTPGQLLAVAASIGCEISYAELWDLSGQLQMYYWPSSEASTDSGRCTCLECAQQQALFCGHRTWWAKALDLIRCRLELQPS